MPGAFNVEQVDSKLVRFKKRNMAKHRGRLPNSSGSEGIAVHNANLAVAKQGQQVFTFQNRGGLYQPFEKQPAIHTLRAQGTLIQQNDG